MACAAFGSMEDMRLIAARTPLAALAAGLLVILAPRAWAADPGAKAAFDAFAISFNAWGGGTPLASASLPVPDEWRRALPKGGGVLPDDALRGAWPN